MNCFSTIVSANLHASKGGYMKIMGFLLLTCLASVSAFASEKTYGLHLFFDEKEFVDVLKLKTLGHSVCLGHMSVPDDFEDDISNCISTGLDITFDLLVPRNSSRTKDMVFEYHGRFFDRTHKQMIGYVKLKRTERFIASFVAFERKQGEKK